MDIGQHIRIGNSNHSLRTHYPLCILFVKSWWDFLLLTEARYWLFYAIKANPKRCHCLHAIFFLFFFTLLFPCSHFILLLNGEKSQPGKRFFCRCVCATLPHSATTALIKYANGSRPPQSQFIHYFFWIFLPRSFNFSLHREREREISLNL